MERVLRILDVSSYIHAGNVNKYAKLSGPVVKTDRGYTVPTIAAGGISLIFNELYAHYGTCDYIFCCDRNPTIKKGMYPDYKSSREHKRSISTGKDVAEYILKSCGFTVMYGDGYEADDYIYSCAKRFQKEYDRIYVHVGDSDLYFLVNDNTSIAKTHSQTKEVDMNNYSVKCARDATVPYNTCTFRKVLFGDTSDNIPALPVEQQSYLQKLFYNEHDMPLLGNKEFVRAVIEQVAPWALHQVDLVYPLDTDTPDNIAKGDKDLVRAWGYAMNNKCFRSPEFEDNTGRIKADIEEMITMGFSEEGD